PPAEPAPAPVPEEPRLPEDGMVAQFKATQVKLPPETQAILTRLAATLEPTERLEITGYCHRKDAPVDAREIALMRAMAVRNELVKQGVPAKSIRVKFNTTQALHAVKITAK
ncbi:flagellar motor protein MotB, partial [Acidovorax sp. HMWF029]